MKKAFDQNVSRAKPRLRLGALSATVEPEAPAQRVAQPAASAPSKKDLAGELKSRASKLGGAKPSATQAIRAAIERVAEPTARQVDVSHVADQVSSRGAAVATASNSAPIVASHAAIDAPMNAAPMSAAMDAAAMKVATDVTLNAATQARSGSVTHVLGEDAAISAMRAEIFGARALSSEPIPSTVEVQNPPLPDDVGPSVFPSHASLHAIEQPEVAETNMATVSSRVVETQVTMARVEFAPPSANATELPIHEDDTESRRERLRERLKAVRENPRPEPLPASVAEAGVRAVERISALQTELTRVKALNLALTQDLEGARRQAEKATEEARLRMDEARRLSGEMETRAKLLEELERELNSLEGERDESLLALQEARQGLTAAADERTGLEDTIAEKDRLLADTLLEEERIASELEAVTDETQSLRRAVDTLNAERETLARQVADLTQERAELLEARRALEAVHRALAQAAAR